MKKLFVFLSCLVLLSFPFLGNAESTPEAVVEMTCIVKLPDVIREGKYTGQVVDGVPHGYGVFVTENSSGIRWHYIGEWENGNMTGQGGQYWDIGQCHVGTFENGDLQCGYVRQYESPYGWIDRTPNEHGCYSAIEYRADGSILLECCLDPKTGAYHMGTVYTKKGDVFFSGTFGAGFDWSLIYVE